MKESHTLVILDFMESGRKDKVQKIDFCLLIEVNNANPNGDPINHRSPRMDYEGYGEIIDVCIKRKVRNRLHQLGKNVFLGTRESSEYGSLQEWFNDFVKNNKLEKSKDTEIIDLICKEYLDARLFGACITYSKNPISIRGCVTFRNAISIAPIDKETIYITKSINATKSKSKSSDTFGYNDIVPHGLYKLCGSINPLFAERVGLNQNDIDLFKESLSTLLQNDASFMRPDGSMEIRKFIWWEQEEELVSSAKVHRLLDVKCTIENPRCYDDYKITLHTNDKVISREII